MFLIGIEYVTSQLLIVVAILILGSLLIFQLTILMHKGQDRNIAQISILLALPIPVPSKLSTAKKHSLIITIAMSLFVLSDLQGAHCFI